MSKDNEKLIEEALRPITDLDVTQNPAATRAFIGQLGAALAVFEKAHTPTDDEREAQGWREEPSADDGCRMCANSEGQEHSRACHFDEHTGCEGIAEGHDYVPCGCVCHEPRGATEKPRHGESEHIPSYDCEGCYFENEPQGQPSDAQRNWDLGPNEDISTTIGFDQGWTVTVNRHAFGCSLVWERTGSWDDHLTDLLPSEVDELVSAISPSTPRPHRCSQGEPSEAQVEAAWAVLERDGLTVLERSHVRAALRAAAAVTEQGD